MWQACDMKFKLEVSSPYYGGETLNILDRKLVVCMFFCLRFKLDLSSPTQNRNLRINLIAKVHHLSLQIMDFFALNMGFHGRAGGCARRRDGRGYVRNTEKG